MSGTGRAPIPDPAPGFGRNCPTAPASVAGHFRMQSTGQLVTYQKDFELAPTPAGVFTDKVAKYRWRAVGNPGRFMWIDKSELQVDRSYQREDEYRAKINSIASDWKWESCGAISVMRRPNGQLMVIDGQNRTLAAWRRSDISELPCMVFESTGLAHEASSFIEINTNRKPVSAFVKFRASLVANDKVAMDIKEVLTENGLTLKPDGNTPGTITCVSACQRIYKHSNKHFRPAVSMAAALAREENVYVCSILLGGLAVLDRKIPGGINNEPLAERLYQVGAKSLVDSARKMSYRIGKGGEVVWAEGMLELINSKRGRKFSFEKSA